MNVRCPACGAAVALAAGDTRLACPGCGLAAPVSRLGTAPGSPAAATIALEAELTGTTVGAYAVGERIGAGGMGTVYRACGPDGDVAIKVLRPALGGDQAEALARFGREAAALRRLDHPRVVRLLDHGQDGASAFIVTELVDGRDLAARLAVGRLELAEVIDLFGQVCDGVAAAHAAGIVHRDLKPANILVGTGGVKVADFGLAQLGPDAAVTTLTRTDVAMGTFHYLAPEQRKDARAVDHRADVWALGVILYEMLTGELPLGSFAPPSLRGPRGCDRRADAIVRRALAPDPSARFASVVELGAAVRGLAGAPRHRRIAAALAVLAVLGAGTAGAAGLVGGRDAAAPAAVASLDARETDAPTAAAAIVDATIDAPPDVAPDAAVDAAVDAAPPPRPVVRPPPTGESPAKIKKPDPRPALAICQKARRCCTSVKGTGCGALLAADAATCEDALAGFRERATNPKQRFVCQ